MTEKPEVAGNAPGPKILPRWRALVKGVTKEFKKELDTELHEIKKNKLRSGG
jgi:hypothetical protein